MRVPVSAAFAMVAAALTATVSMTAARAGDAPATEIVLDGKRDEARTVALDGGGAAPRADDLLQIGGSSGFEILRGASSTFRFRRAGEQLFEIAADGAETLVALKLGGGGGGGDPPHIDPLALTPEVTLHLRGVIVESDWEHRLDPLFARLDGARCFVACVALEDGTLPPLPAGLRALRVQSQFPDGTLDLAPLASQPDLRWFEATMGRVADFGPLRAAQRLTRFEGQVHPENAASMPELRALREFRLAMHSEVRDASFLARFPALVTLDVSHSLVRDLSAIDGLNDLLELDAEDTRIAALPRSGLTGLRKARLFGHRAPPADLARFVAQHPAAEIRHDRRAEFVAGLAGADGIRLWHAEGTPRANSRTNRHEATGADAVREFLDCVRFDEHAYGWSCLCAEAAPVEIEVLGAGRVVASLGIRHEGTVVDGLGGGVLTDASIAALSAWLAARGFPECAEMGARVAKSHADARRPAEIAAVWVGAERIQELRDATSDVATSRALRDLAATTDERVTLCLRAWHAVVMACGEEAARRGTAREIRHFLRDIEDAGAVAAVADRMLASPADAPIAAWFVAGLPDARGRFPEAWRVKSRLAAARVLLSIDEPNGRDLALRTLRDLGTPDAVPDLLRLLPAASPAADDSDGAAVPRVSRAGPAPPTQFQVDVATLLARWCDAAVLPRLRAIASAAPGDADDRTRALARFDEAVASRN